MEELYMKLTSPESDGLTDEEFEEYKSLTTENKLTERKVLKVGNGGPEMPMQQDPMAQQGGMDAMNGMGDMQGDGMEEMPQGDLGMEDNASSDFDTNFDAGVEADEDEDPKKYIQQLTGKLSQEFGKYNNELGEPDTELSKYVGGMIIQQVAKNLDEPGRKELIKKLKTADSSEDNEMETELDGNEDFEDNETSDEMKMESYTISGSDVKKLMETFNSEIETEKPDQLKAEKEKTDDKKRKAFEPKKFN